jgi:hypothetical protein
MDDGSNNWKLHHPNSRFIEGEYDSIMRHPRPYNIAIKPLHDGEERKLGGKRRKSKRRKSKRIKTKRRKSKRR